MGILLRDRPGLEYQKGGGFRLGPRILIALVIAAFSLFSYFSNTEFNPITEKKQHLAMTPNQEIALGLQSRPEMENKFGGLSNDPVRQAEVDTVGNDIVSKSAASRTPYKFEFHLLADPQTVNAFALPGGQIYLTEGLREHLTTKGQLAGVLGHEIGHVVARHSAQHIAKQQLTQGLTGAAAVATYDPYDPSSRNSAAIAALIGNIVNMKFGRADELESDRLGVRFLSEAGYDPRGMIEVMNILAKTSRSRTPEFFSTHPNPENRITRIKEAIDARYPDGVPENLID